jgi:hypothetical protein
LREADRSWLGALLRKGDVQNVYWPSDLIEARPILAHRVSRQAARVQGVRKCLLTINLLRSGVSQARLSNTPVRLDGVGESAVF